MVGGISWSNNPHVCNNNKIAFLFFPFFSLFNFPNSIFSCFSSVFSEEKAKIAHCRQSRSFIHVTIFQYRERTVSFSLRWYILLLSFLYLLLIIFYYFFYFITITISFIYFIINKEVHLHFLHIAYFDYITLLLFLYAF